MNPFQVRKVVSWKIRQSRRKGFTITELLISTVITLLVMAALAQAFKQLSDSIAEGRSKLTMSDRLRSINAIIRQDLEGATVNPTVAYAKSQGIGYFEYYDGVASDFTSTIYGFNAAGTTLSARFPLTRFGDFDDILMFTAKAKNEPFQGKVPSALIKAKDGRFNEITAADWDPANRVVITSDYAEIIYFMAPTPSEEAVLAAAQTGTPLGTLFDTTTGMVNFKSTAVAGFPDGFTLYRRVLLIRPDLNIDPTSWAGFSTEFGDPLELTTRCLFHVDPTKSRGVPYASQTVSLNAVELHVMTGNMSAFQNADLSMRRIPDPVASNPAAMAANSLEDLMLRENRFAHCMIPGQSTLVSSEPMPFKVGDSTMPILALTPPLTIQSGAVNFPLPSATGFLRSEFILWGDRVGEDMLMSNATGLDIRVFDPNVPLYFHRGNDAANGKYGIGDAGSDDMVVSPSDPGYVEGMYPTTLGDRNDKAPIAETDATTQANYAGKGAFVDIGWGAKIWKLCIDKANYRGVLTYGGSLSRWGAHFTGLEVPPTADPIYITNAAIDAHSTLNQSGLVMTNPTSTKCYVYQNTYDTGYDRYEIDGRRQEKRGTVIRQGTYWFNGAFQMGFSNSASAEPATPVIDASRDGLDSATPELSNGDGMVDDDFEKETNPPFLEVLQALEIRVRAEDPGTGAIQQTVITTDFRSR